MTSLKDLSNKISVQYDEYLNLSKRMYLTSSLEELQDQIELINHLFRHITSLLNLYRKEQPDNFNQNYKDIISKIANKNRVINENLERLDSNYDYEQGVLEDNED